MRKFRGFKAEVLTIAACVIHWVLLIGVGYIIDNYEYDLPEGIYNFVCSLGDIMFNIGVIMLLLGGFAIFLMVSSIASYSSSSYSYNYNYSSYYDNNRSDKPKKKKYSNTVENEGMFLNVCDALAHGMSMDDINKYNAGIYDYESDLFVKSKNVKKMDFL